MAVCHCEGCGGGGVSATTVLLGDEISAHLAGHLFDYRGVFRVEGREFRMATAEEVPASVASDEEIVVVDNVTGALALVEVEVFVSLIDAPAVTR